MEVLHPELRKVVSDLDLTQESRDLLLATLIGEGKTIAPNDALGLLWLLGSLRSDGILGLIPLQKTHSLENLITLIRHGHEEWVSRVCYILYEGDLPPQRTSSFLPEGTIRDLLRWVNAEKSEKVRESLWAILLRKNVGLAIVAKIPDVAIGLCEKDPITRNNVIRFLFDHFTPDEVVESLFQYSMASGKRIPGLVFKRYVSLLKDKEDQPQKKYILEKILNTAKLDGKEIDQIFSEYINSLNRFDLIRLLSTAGDRPPQIEELKRKGKQKGFVLSHGSAAFAHSTPFHKRISLIRQALA
jgi:hypothetical protein